MLLAIIAINNQNRHDSSTFKDVPLKIYNSSHMYYIVTCFVVDVHAYSQLYILASVSMILLIEGR